MGKIPLLPPGSIAPWGEIVHDAPAHMTLDDFLAYKGEDGFRYELVEGVLVRMAGTRPRAGRVTRNLLFPLAAYAQAHSLGTVTPPDEVYDFEQSGQKDTGCYPTSDSTMLLVSHWSIPTGPILLPPIWPSK